MTAIAYLAGPDVFLPNAVAHAATKVEICRRLGLRGLPPLNETAETAATELEVWQAIYEKDVAMMEKSDIIIANLTPFANPIAVRGLGIQVRLPFFVLRGQEAEDFFFREQLVIRPRFGSHFVVAQNSSNMFWRRKMLFPPIGAFYYAATVAAILLTTLFYGMNSGLRDEVNQAISPREVPERLTHGYSQKQFQEFQKVAATSAVKSTTALELYRGRILFLDIGFCVFCGVASFLLWGLVEKAALSVHALSLFSNHGAAASVYIWVVPKLCSVGAVFSILYGFIDAAEDVTLIYLLGEQTPTTSQVQFASFLTVAKIVTIICSVFGAALFKILGLIF